MQFLLLGAMTTILVSRGPNGPPLAQLCPTNPSIGWTAAHVVDALDDPYWFAGGFTGALRVLSVDHKKDLAMVYTETPFPFYRKFGPTPETGDPIHLFGFDLFAKGVYVIRGFYFGIDKDGEAIYSAVVHGGTSGSCVLNSEDQAVAVNLGSVLFKPTENEDWPLIAHGRGRPLKEKMK